MAQSRAISRYLAKGVKVDGAPLYPDDAWLAFQVDEFVDALEDVRLYFLIPTFKIADQKEKEEKRAALFATDGSGELFEGLKKIDKLIGSDGHMVGGKLSLADIWLFCTVGTFRSGFLDGIPIDGWLDKLPNLKACIDKVAAQPAVKAYYTKKNEESKLYGAFASP